MKKIKIIVKENTEIEIEIETEIRVNGEKSY